MELDLELVDGEEVEEKYIVPRDEKGRWLKGASPNPTGRPKKDMSLTEIVRKALKAKREKEGITIAQQLIEVLIEKALAGDKDAINILLDRGFGKAKAFLELSSKTEFDVDWGDSDENIIEGGNDEEATNQSESPSS